MRRRRFVGLAAAGMVGALTPTVTACGSEASGRSDDGDDITLKMIAADYGDIEGTNGSQAYWDDLIDTFEQDNPSIKVAVSVHSWGKIHQELAGMMKKGDVPDIVQIDSYAEYAVADELYRASEVLSLTDLAAFMPFLATAGEINRVQYGMPFVASTRRLFYNKALFAQADLDPDAPPKTWKEVRDAAAALRDAGVNIPYGLPLGPEEGHAEAMTWMVTNDGGYTGNAGSYTIDSEENTATLQWLRDELVGEGLTTVNPDTTDRQNLFDLFTRGQVGMLNGTPALMRDAEAKKIDYGTAPLPGNSGASKATLGATDWIMAFKKNGHREAIGKFLSFVYTVDNHYAFARRHNLLPVTSAASERMQDDSRHKSLLPFLDQLPTARFFPVSKPSWTPTSRAIKQSIGKAVLAGGRPESVLSALQRKAGTAEAAATP